MAAEPAWLAVLGGLLVGFGAGIPFSPAFTAAARIRPDAPAASVGLVNAAANFAVLVGTPLVGLSFSLRGEGRLGFVAIAILWLGAIAVLPSRTALGRRPYSSPNCSVALTPRNPNASSKRSTRHAQPDERLERIAPAGARAVEAPDRVLPVARVRVHAAEQRAVLEDRVDAENAPVEADLARAPVHAEQARDPVAPQQRERVEHDLRVARRLDHEVEAARPPPRARASGISAVET